MDDVEAAKFAEEEVIRLAHLPDVVKKKKKKKKKKKRKR